MLRVGLLIVLATLPGLSPVLSDTHDTGKAAHADGHAGQGSTQEGYVGDYEAHTDHGELNFLTDFFGTENTEDDGHLEQHLKEDLGLERSVENMTDTEKDWYYFKLHDTNEDFTLDGLELLKAWQHHYLEHMGHEGLSHTGNSTEETKKYIDSQNEVYVGLVDQIIEEQDLNNDGYLDYLEYMMAKIKSREEEEKHKEEQKKKDAVVKK